MPDLPTAKIYFEVEATVTGTYVPGCAERGPSYASGREPAEADGFEGMEVLTLGAVTWRHAPADLRLPTVTEIHSLMDGVNVRSPDVQQLLANILRLHESDAEAALMEAGEP